MKPSFPEYHLTQHILLCYCTRFLGHTTIIKCLQLRLCVLHARLAICISHKIMLGGKLWWKIEGSFTIQFHSSLIYTRAYLTARMPIIKWTRTKRQTNETYTYNQSYLYIRQNTSSGIRTHYFIVRAGNDCSYLISVSFIIPLAWE
jgi:hypothetical protein